MSIGGVTLCLFFWNQTPKFTRMPEHSTTKPNQNRDRNRIDNYGANSQGRGRIQLIIDGPPMYK